MPSPARDSTSPQVGYCSHCKEEFALYRSTEEELHCPRCGRAAHKPVQRRRLRLLAVAILAAVAIAVIAVKLFHL